MRKLPEQSGFAVVDAALRYASLRLHAHRSHEGVDALANTVKQQRSRLQEANEAWAVAHDERVASTQEIHYHNSLVVSSLSDLNRGLLAWVKGDRKDPRFAQIMPQAMSKLTRDVASDAQNHFVKSTIATIKNNAAYATFQESAEQLEKAQTGLDVAIQKRGTAYVNEQQQQNALRVALDASIQLYHGLYPRLQILLNDENWVETFFVPFIKKDSKNKEETSKDETPADEGNTPNA